MNREFFFVIEHCTYDTNEVCFIVFYCLIAKKKCVDAEYECCNWQLRNLIIWLPVSVIELKPLFKCQSLLYIMKRVLA